MRVGVVINGGARRIRHDSRFIFKLKKVFAEERVEAIFQVCPPGHILDSCRSAAQNGVELLVAVGGDGTISTVAGSCLELGLPLGVVAAGTHNHFARDLRLPLDPAEAVRCVARGRLWRVDVAEVNGIPFINNSSVGAYPRAVEERDALIERFGLRKSVAQILATLKVFARRPLVSADIEIDGKLEHCATPFVFVGNNEYRVRPIQGSLRESLAEGRLCVFTADRTGLAAFARLLWGSLRGRLEENAEFHTRIGETAVVRLPQDSVRLAKDGEVLRLETPLHYSVRKQALPVIVP